MTKADESSCLQEQGEPTDKGRCTEVKIKHTEGAKELRRRS